MKIRRLIGALLAAALIGAASAQLAAADELRAFWVDAFGAGFKTQAQVDKLLGRVGDPNSLGDIREANCNAVFVEVRLRANVAYPSALGEPYMPGLTPSNFNALQAMIDAAHDTTGGKQRVEVHAWIVSFATASGSYVSSVYYDHNNPNDPVNYWITRDSSGAESSDKAFDPGHPGVQRYITDVCMDIVNNFDVDGLHFDYIRYTGSTLGYNPTNIARFNARYNRTGQPSSSDTEFNQWRRDQVTSLVRRVYAHVMASRPEVKVSAALIGGTPAPLSSTRSAFFPSQAYKSYFQDWDLWLQEGILDQGLVMSYFDVDDRYWDHHEKWRNFIVDRRAGRHAIFGPGLYMNDLQDSLMLLLTSRNPTSSGKYGQGYCGYVYKTPCEGCTWDSFEPHLRAVVNPQPDVVPEMEWKTNPTTGLIGGTVSSAGTGQGLDGAIVTVTGPRTQYTDGTGFFAFTKLPPGTYHVVASMPGFSTWQQPVTVAAGETLMLNITLQPTGCTYPVISSVAAQAVTATRATITWTTDVPSTGQVEFGATAAYGSISSLDPALTTQHSIVLEGLDPSTDYHFRVMSTPSGGCTGYSLDNVFTTAAGASVDDVVIEVRNSSGTRTPSPTYSETGAWGDSTAKSSAQGLTGLGSRYASSYSSKTAVFVPNLPVSGPYDVFVTWGSSTNGANTNFKVISGGSQVYNTNWDQHSGAGLNNQWNLLGRFEFDAGQGATNASVRIDGSATTNPRALTSPRLMSDAVKFVFKGVIGDSEPPSQPQNLMLDVDSQSQISLNWSASSDNVGVTGYRVYRDSSLVDMVETPGYVDAGLSANTSYSYQVAAVDAAGNQSLLSTPQGAVTLSEPPSELNVIASRETGVWYTTNGFQFSPAGGFGPGTVSRYRVAWDQNPIHEWGAPEEFDWPAGSITRSAMLPGAWYLHLKGFNSAGIENGTMDFGPFLYDPTPPLLPVVDDGKYAAEGAPLEASWTAEDPDSGILRSEYRVLSASNDVLMDWTDAGGNLQASVAGLGLPAGSAYRFEVRVTNQAELVSTAGASNGALVAGSVGSVAEARLLAEDTAFVLQPPVPVSAGFPGSFYVSDANRSAGLLVQGTLPDGASAVTLGGILKTLPTLEKFVFDPEVDPADGVPGVEPLSVTLRTLGGRLPGREEQIGAFSGLSSTGLLIRAWGRIASAGAGYFYLDDGSGLSDGGGSLGVRVEGSGLLPAEGDYVTITGISSAWVSGGVPHPLIKVVSWTAL